MLALADLILNHPGLTLADQAPMLNCHLSHNAGNFLGFKWKTDLHVDKKIASLNLMILSSSMGVRQPPVCRDNLQLAFLGCLLSLRLTLALRFFFFLEIYEKAIEFPQKILKNDCQFQNMKTFWEERLWRSLYFMFMAVHRRTLQKRSS